MQNITICSSPATVGKPQYTTVKLPLYNCVLYIRIVDNVKKEIERLYKKYKIKDEFEDEAEGAVVSPNLEICYLLLGRHYITHNTIAHEVFHVSKRITEDRGITDEESQAWLAGHVTGELYKFLDKKKLIVKHG